MGNERQEKSPVGELLFSRRSAAALSLAERLKGLTALPVGKADGLPSAGLW